MGRKGEGKGGEGEGEEGGREGRGGRRGEKKGFNSTDQLLKMAKGLVGGWRRRRRDGVKRE